MTNGKKLLREYIRQSLRKESGLLEASIRVGDLRSAMEYARGKKLKDAMAAASKEAGKKGIEFGLKALASLIPGAAAVAGAIETGIEIKDLYDAAKSVNPKEREKNPLWDLITIDPDTSAIIDDGVENEFIDILKDRIKYLDDNDVLPDADTQLNNFLKAKFNKKHIASQ